MHDDIIEQLATCGERISDGVQLSRHTRWRFAYQADGSLSELGTDLIGVLANAYSQYDQQKAEEEAKKVTRPSVTAPIPASQFYGSSRSTRRVPPSSPIHDDPSLSGSSTDSEDIPLRQRHRGGPGGDVAKVHDRTE